MQLPAMTKKDFSLMVVLGAAVGLLIQPIMTNALPRIGLSMLDRALILVFFAALAPFLIWLSELLSRFFKGIYQFAQFAAVGTLNSFIDIGVFNFETAIYGITPVSTAAFVVFKAISFLCGTTNSFFWNKYWTFSTNRATHPEGAIKETKEAASFYVIAGIGWAVNVGVATAIKLLEPSGVSSKLWVNVVAPLCGIAASFIWDFLGYKYVVFKKS
jgi:putative flippase GtrA